jgi:inosine/xanthosine triphosphate pyrophosphatase family protein
MALAENGSTRATFEGRVEGRVISGERGSGGFGYDSLFVPVGFQETFGELPGTTKNGLSHRARALAKVIEYLFVVRARPPAGLANNRGQGHESTAAGRQAGRPATGGP